MTELKFDPLTGDPMPNAQKSFLKPEEAPDMSKLEDMTKNQLIALVRLLNGVSTALLTPDEIMHAFKIRLAHGGLTERDMFKALPLMREWMDRERGKAAQSIAMTIEDKGLGKLSDERLLRLECELSRITGADALIIPPEPQKL